ncbi:GFA family protein [Aureimonas leprariae]|uniref:GFA family protein n=1 Tax=Plantimonas leprariae TaxID=2615207 RepID=A0A7V7TYU7_9HYPH|nr:GFA family protein [Aureimonas leprariae]KAB0677988.1 GFA family protein [Aureimonas leprariae]
MAYEGSCHCGRVAFTVEGDLPAEAMSCNCSHCRRKGFLFTFVPLSQFALTRGEAELATYDFNTHRIHHRFCTTCGVEPFAEGTGPTGEPVRAVNLRVVPAADLDALGIQKVDGASF